MSEAVLIHLIPLDLTHVLSCLCRLSVQTRELLFIEMWIGQMLCEAFNWVIKHIVEEDRPHSELGEGFGFPSSHSQWMGYFATFLICHLTFRHRFIPTGWRVVDIFWRGLVYIGLMAWAVAVAYSRYYLSYHTLRQVIWGLSIGILFGMWYYTVVEILPAVWPTSLFGRARIAALGNPVSTWFRIRDGWAVWGDGGKEGEWLRWRAEWERSKLNDVGSSSKKE